MSAEWRLLGLDEVRATWNARLEQFDDCSPFQTLEWGEYYRDLGWEPVHFMASSQAGKVEAMCLGLLRRFPFRTGFVWSPGGPVGDPAAWHGGLRQAMLAGLGLKRLFVRFRCDREARASDARLLARNGWVPSTGTMGSKLRMELDLDPEPDALLAGLSGAWRRNLRRAEREGLVVRRPSAHPNVAEVRRVFAEMESLKKIPELFSRDRLESLFRHSGGRLIFFQCEDRDGNLLAIRGTFLIGDRAWDYLNAASAEGRRRRASYLLLWRTLRYCREQGIRSYDLGGIDPEADAGIHQFKRQTGARAVEFLGEWDWATSTPLRLVGNWAIRQRRRIKALVARPASFPKASPVVPAAKIASGSLVLCLLD